jgi:ABC-2 type transport system ATP-binding protein
MTMAFGFSKAAAKAAFTPEYTEAVTVKGLAKYFGDFHAVDGIDFSVHKGEIFGFLGPNGSGKTTTIRMLCGVIDPSGGDIDVLGYDVRTQAEAVKERIGYMSQKFSLFEELSVEENLKFYAGIYGLSDEKYAERRAYVLKMADLEGREDEMTKNLSVGWKQRLALGCSTIHEPELLFLDEPTSGVDPIARRQFWELLYELAANGVTLFVTTHYMDEAAHCNRLAFMYRGRLVAEGSPQSVRELMQDTVVALTVDDAEAAMEALEGVSEVKEVYMHGAMVHANIGELDIADFDLAGLLSAEGVYVEEIKPVEPSLEDVFVHLVNAQREGEAA